MDVAGFLLVDKPSGWTSHDVVAKLRGVTGIKRIGHGGTLDPLATGLLVVGVGAATKRLEQFVQGDKAYLATVRLGTTSTTDDAEGELTKNDSTFPSESQVRGTLETFIGEQDQLPPIYSAIKTAGRKHYDLARAGTPADRETRRVTIKSIELVEYAWPDLSFRTTVSKGTYVRALARDLGEKLRTGAYLSALRRESVAPFSLDQAATVEIIEKDWRKHLLTLDALPSNL